MTKNYGISTYKNSYVVLESCYDIFKKKIFKILDKLDKLENITAKSDMEFHSDLVIKSDNT